MSSHIIIHNKVSVYKHCASIISPAIGVSTGVTIHRVNLLKRLEKEMAFFILLKFVPK